MISGLLAIESAMRCPVLVVTRHLPSEIVGECSVVMEVEDGRLTFAKPAAGKGWAREFTLGRIKLVVGESVAVRPGAIANFNPRWKV